MASALFLMYEQHQDQNFISRDFTFDMRKSQKVSRAYSSGFVPEYSNALETTGESDGVRGQKNRSFGKQSSFGGFGGSGRIDIEKSGSFGGFGGSGRVDLEATASENSCTPKRKSISLSLEKSEGFYVPVQVYALSVMSRSERRELGKRLKIELEQVRSIHKKIESKVSNTVTVSSSSDLPSFSSGQKNSRFETGPMNGTLVKPSIEIPPSGSLNSNSKDKRTPKANQLYVNSEFVSGKDKMVQPDKPKSKGPMSGVKRGISGRFESRDEKRQREDTPVQHSKPDATIMKQCTTLLRRLMGHKFGWVFNTPVDVVKLNIPDYFKVIKKPMDLGTIKKRIDAEIYTSPRDFASDVRLTFANAMKYNPPGNDVHIMADTLNKMFEEKWLAIERKIRDSESNVYFTKGIQSIPAKQQQQQYDNKIIDKPKQFNKPKPAPSSVEHKPKPEHCKRPMSIEEKQKLSRDLEALPGDMPEEIIDFLRKHSSDLSQNEDEIEVDIDAFDNDTLLELRTIVTNCQNGKDQGAARNQLKVDPREAETLQPSNGTRLGNNSPIYTRKGGDPGDEDVDIGEDDLPASNYPPVVIEKDTAGRSSKCSSSSSSSSDSGSSSSDSDSASSSGSESDAAKAPSPDAAPKEPMSSGAICDQRTSPSLETHGAKRAVSELDEENAHLKPAIGATDADAHQEGESAPSERQVSPDKLYRAALLRNRFADTILKAQEKTLNQGDRGDPEKLRREREELERRQREEKARLQAEAEAAEMARMQAEAVAAAEAKRKREIEREAARLALQKMEKTVEIDENSQILKDLEMLRSSQLDHLSSGDETSPIHSQDGLAPFTLQGRNPLEQLGLFMKMDEEEEEEEANPDCVGGNGDVEEGEID
eukprot:Gb_30202 [translate_table: standard]